MFLGWLLVSLDSLSSLKTTGAVRTRVATLAQCRSTSDRIPCPPGCYVTSTCDSNSPATKLDHKGPKQLNELKHTDACSCIPHSLTTTLLNIQWSRYYSVDMWSHDSSVGVVTLLHSGRYRSRIRAGGKRSFSSPKCPYLLWCPNSVLFSGCWSLLLGIKRPGREVGH